jgi:SAM-dependent methyltransferase
MSRADLRALLACPECGETIRVEGERAYCDRHSFPVENGIPRLLPNDLMRVREGAKDGSLRARTYASFGYEWETFASNLSSYRDNFLWYREPLGDVSLAGQTVLDAGCGMGRHTHQFLAEGAHVLAIDASAAIDVAARNNPSGAALFVQGDILKLPVMPGAFDLACCLGVLHHIDDTRAALGQLVKAVRPGGKVLVYLYHDPAETSRTRGALLGAVSLLRKVTTRLPMAVLHPVAALIAALLYLFYIGPMKVLARVGVAAVRGLPLGQYVDYPFRVLWNDQFDRFSAPLEKRYRRAAVEALLLQAGLTDIRILGGYGWRASARVP